MHLSPSLPLSLSFSHTRIFAFSHARNERKEERIAVTAPRLAHRRIREALARTDMQQHLLISMSLIPTPHSNVSHFNVSHSNVSHSNISSFQHLIIPMSLIPHPLPPTTSIYLPLTSHHRSLSLSRTNTFSSSHARYVTLSLHLSFSLSLTHTHSCFLARMARIYCSLFICRSLSHTHTFFCLSHTHTFFSLSHTHTHAFTVYLLLSLSHTHTFLLARTHDMHPST